MIENANGAVWKKLIQTCKFFYPKKDLYPVEKFSVYNDESRRIDCSLIIDGKYFEAKYSVPKLWVYNSFNSGSKPTGLPDDVKTVLSKIFKFDLRRLDLRFQSLTFEDYQILTSSGTIKELNFCKVNITHSHGTKVSADKLFDNLYNLEVFKSDRHSLQFEADTAKKIANNLPRLQKLRSFELTKLEEGFDVSSFSDFLMKNETVFVRFDYLWNEFSNAYKQIIEAFIDKILKNPPKILPIIEFPGCDDLKFAEY
uniref:Uncharacterized protein n=1 Tax=Panagrolaimus sp. ES5 TaxID=591445 RepID=A0AC34F2M1_9BILA